MLINVFPLWHIGKEKKDFFIFFEVNHILLILVISLNNITVVILTCTPNYSRSTASRRVVDGSHAQCEGEDCSKAL